MKRLLFLAFIFLFFHPFISYAQGNQGIYQNIRGGGVVQDSTSTNKSLKVKLSGKTKFTDYKIFSLKRDTSFVDTTLTIKKHYKYNFLRKDNFELLPFHNIGQPFNHLAYNFHDQAAQPDIGFRAKQFFHQEIHDILYYDVPTQTTEIMFLTTLEQGQFLESLYTANLSRRFNFSVSYRGLRSLGKYRRSLISQGNFKTTFRYETKENQYTIKGHIITQDLTSEESGGLTSTSLTAFLNNDPNFTDRGRLDVNLTGTENEFRSARLYFQHDYKLLIAKDSANQKNFTNLKVGHQFTSEGKSYAFTQSAVDTNFFGTTVATGAVNDKVGTDFLDNQLFLEFNSKYVLGRFRVKSNLTRLSYGYGEILNSTSGITNRRREENAASFGADWNAKVKNFYLDASGQITPGNSQLSGTNLKGQLTYKKDSLFTIKTGLNIQSKSPNFNFLFHQSSYNLYNWENNYENIKTQNIRFQFASKWINTDVNFSNIDNYTYFGTDNLPKQAAESIRYLKVKASREFRYGSFALDNTLMYQNVSSGSAIFRVPEFVTRNTLYYTGKWFHKERPLKVQIGATFKYFTKYRANAYNPLLAEFTLQNTDEIGFSTVDVFFNAQVRRTRIFFRFDNVLSNFGKRNYFSAPNYPYRDAVLRFGLVWNWFI